MRTICITVEDISQKDMVLCLKNLVLNNYRSTLKNL